MNRQIDELRKAQDRRQALEARLDRLEAGNSLMTSRARETQLSKGKPSTQTEVARF